jgi:3-deoxy-D-manno-octulosonate 8-phosphate phosphatase (KDO 8-P phosphatase)
MDIHDLFSLFTENGGHFHRSADEFAHKLSQIKAYIFDWDGVFNDGTKRDQQGSAFNEPDSMGVNLLRFSHFLRFGQLAPTAIITSEANASAHWLAQREDFSALYFKATDKTKSFSHFLAAHNLKPEEVLFVFDDVLDLGVAAQCGLRLTIRRRANPLFNRYLEQQQLTDYFSSGQGYGVREVCELLIGLHGNYDLTISERKAHSPRYLDYLTQRQASKTAVWTGGGEMAIAVQDGKGR